MGFGKQGKGCILREIQTITVGALASGVAIKAASQVAIEDDFRIMKSEYFMVVRDQAAGSVVPVDHLLIGIANNELSVGEIAECIAVDGPKDRNDAVPNERSHRAVWLLEILEHIGDANLANRNSRESTKGEWVNPWTFSNGDGWTWFAYNPSGAAATSGMVIDIVAKHYGVWVT